MKASRTLLAASLFLTSTVAAQSDFSSLEELMTGNEFQAAGLDKLSDAELNSLNNWLRQHLKEDYVVTREPYDAGPGFEDRDDEDREEFTAVIPGHFAGWQGHTVFELKNGQVWQQVSGGSYRVSMEDPIVVLYPSAFGSWRLRLKKYGPSIGVIRIE